MVAGKTLLKHTAAAALRATQLTRIVVSTDDEEIAAASRQYGLQVPFMRPAELAKDDTPTIPVLQDVIRRLAETDDPYDAVFTLQPTNPLRMASDIDGAIELLERTGADSVIGFTPVGERHPARMKFLDADGRVCDPDFAEQFEGQRRQELRPLYLREGSVYLTRTSVLMEQNSIQGRDCRAWIIPRERACNIDEPFDLYLCEQLLGRNLEEFPGRPGGDFGDRPIPVSPHNDGDEMCGGEG
jgi:N-acylneuraminate cytidylyltransferase